MCDIFVLPPQVEQSGLSTHVKKLPLNHDSNSNINMSCNDTSKSEDLPEIILKIKWN